MVAAAAFPLAKLAFLLIRQASKPVAKSIANRAKQSPLFKNYVCVPVAQLFHFYEVKVKLRALNIGGGKLTKVPKLSETKAVEQGSEILAEAIVWSTAAGILIYEYNRSKEKDDAKEEKLKVDRESIRNKIYELEVQVEKQSSQIRNLAKTAIHLEEELHKSSLKALLGKGPDVPETLRKTVEEIPEFPREIRPLELLEDKVEDIGKESKNQVEVFDSNSELQSKTPIQDKIECHNVKPSMDNQSISVTMAKVAESEPELEKKPSESSLSLPLENNEEPVEKPIDIRKEDIAGNGVAGVVKDSITYTLNILK